MDGPVVVQRVDYTSTHRCDLSQSMRIFSSWAVATTKLLENLPFLRLAYISGLASSNLKSNLRRHFGVAENNRSERQRVLKRLISGYDDILSRMGAGLGKVRCGGQHCGHNWYAYTFGNRRDNIIWLCGVQFQDKPILDLASTWIHELSHNLLGTTDSQYYMYTGATTLGTNAALNEADCWGNFMVSYT